MKLFIPTLLTIFCLISPLDFCYTQTVKTISKSCGKCKKSVPVNSKVGEKCPHCGVIWGQENTQTSTSTSQYNLPSSNYLNINPVLPNQESGNGGSKKQKELENSNSTATKSETENWILEKMRAYTPKKYYDNIGSIEGLPKPRFLTSNGWHNMNYSYSFDNYNLIIRYEHEENNKISNYKILIPIYDIERVYKYMSDIWITTNKETIIEFNETENTKTVTDAFKSKFDIYAETDLCERLNKAFLHLKKFYKKPISKEAF